MSLSDERRVGSDRLLSPGRLYLVMSSHLNIRFWSDLPSSMPLESRLSSRPPFNNVQTSPWYCLFVADSAWMVLQRNGKADNNIWRCMMLPAGSTVALDVAIKYLEDCALAELQSVVAHCGAELVGNGRLELCSPSDGAQPCGSNGHPLLDAQLIQGSPFKRTALSPVQPTSDNLSADEMWKVRNDKSTMTTNKNNPCKGEDFTLPLRAGGCRAC